MAFVLRSFTLLCLIAGTVGCESSSPEPKAAQAEAPVPAAQHQAAVQLTAQPLVAPAEPDPIQAAEQARDGQVPLPRPRIAQPDPVQPAEQAPHEDPLATEKQETRDFISEKCMKLKVNIYEGNELVVRGESSLSFKKDGTLLVKTKRENLSGEVKGDVLLSEYEVSLKDLNPRRCVLFFYGGAGCNQGQRAL